MTNKNIIITVLLVGVAAFSLGRYSVNQPNVKSETKKEEVQDNHTVTQTVTISRPKGGTRTFTTTDSTTVLKSVEGIKTEVIQAKRKTVNVSGLIGYNYFTPTPSALFGASVSSQLIGPVTGGVWGLTNGTIGLSIGLEF